MGFLDKIFGKKKKAENKSVNNNKQKETNSNMQKIDSSNSIKKKCPNCGHDINETAINCGFCGYNFNTKTIPKSSKPKKQSNKKAGNDKQKKTDSNINAGNKECPNCGKLIKKQALRCKYCNYYFKEGKVMPKSSKPKKQLNKKSDNNKQKETKKMSDAEIKSYFQDNIIEDEKEAREILKTVKNQQLLTDIVMSWSGYRKNNLIIIDYIDDEECLSNIYVNCADPECCKKANAKRR